MEDIEIIKIIVHGIVNLVWALMFGFVGISLADAIKHKNKTNRGY